VSDTTGVDGGNKAGSIKAFGNKNRRINLLFAHNFLFLKKYCRGISLTGSLLNHFFDFNIF